MKTKTCWVWLQEPNIQRGTVRFATEAGASPYGGMFADVFRPLFGWLPGERPVEVRLERVDRRKDGTMKANRKPRVTRKRRAK